MTAAAERVEHCRRALSSLEREEDELRYKVRRLMDGLRAHPGPAADASPSVDAERLLDALRDVVGEVDEAEQALEDLEVESRLKRLKKKISGRSNRHERSHSHDPSTGDERNNGHE